MIVVAPEVQTAVASGRPVVALESSIVSQGLPRPINLEVARGLHAAVRDAGAVPAMTAVLDGSAHIGVTDNDIDRLAHDDDIAKTSTVDLAVYMAQGRSAATTVSATLALAARAGVGVMATGGIGGVHRGDSGDESADLLALATQPVVCVSSGVKSILDLPRTLERLETLGVLVVGYGVDNLPGFYFRESDLALAHRFDNIADIARVARLQRELSRAGILVTNPVPVADEVPRAQVEQWVDTALAECEGRGIVGKGVTPYVLGRMADRAGDHLLAANRSLALANAGLAGRLAVELAPRP